MSQSPTRLRKYMFFRLQMPDIELLSTLNKRRSQQVMSQFLMRPRRSTLSRPQMQDSELLSTWVKVARWLIWLKLARSQLVMNQSLTRPRKFMFFRLQMPDIELLSTLKLIHSPNSQLPPSQLDQRKSPCSRLQSLDPTPPSTTRKKMHQLRLFQRRRRLTQLAQNKWTHG